MNEVREWGRQRSWGQTERNGEYKGPVAGRGCDCSRNRREATEAGSE